MNGRLCRLIYRESIGGKKVLSFVVDFLDGSQPVVQAAQLKKRRAQELSDTVDMRCGGFLIVSRGAVAAKIQITYYLSQVSSEFGAESQGFCLCEREGYTFGPCHLHSRPKCLKNLRQTGRRRLLRGSPV